MKPRPQVEGVGAYSSIRHLSGTTGGEIEGTFVSCIDYRFTNVRLLMVQGSEM
jgi:hypothetical protein